MADINKLNGYDIRDNRYDNIASAIDNINDNIESLTNNKQDNITGGASTITEANLQTNRALVSNAVGKVDVSPVTSTELGYMDGVTSNVQTQLDGKQATVTGGASTVTSNNLTANRALISNANGKIAVSPVTSTELGYMDGVTSNVQTQLNSINNKFNTLDANALKKQVKDLGSLYVMTASDFDGYGFFKVGTFSPSSSPEVNSAGNDIGDWWLFKTYNGSVNYSQFIAISARTQDIYHGSFWNGTFQGWQRVPKPSEVQYQRWVDKNFNDTDIRPTRLGETYKALISITNGTADFKAPSKGVLTWAVDTLKLTANEYLQTAQRNPYNIAKRMYTGGAWTAWANVTLQ